jgi:large subunit ribosomal protein L32
MAVPKRKTSQQRKHTRRANWKTSAPALSECSRCHQMKLGHRACPNCGYYDGEKVITVASEKKNEKKGKQTKEEKQEKKAETKAKKAKKEEAEV